MSKLENEFYKRFNNQKLSGDDFDADGLWDDISNDLSSIPSAGSTSSFWNLKWIGLGLGTIVFLGLIGFAFRQTNTPTSNQSTVENLESDNTIVEQRPENSLEYESTKDIALPSNRNQVELSQNETLNEKIRVVSTEALVRSSKEGKIKRVTHVSPMKKSEKTEESKGDNLSLIHI